MRCGKRLVGKIDLVLYNRVGDSVSVLNETFGQEINIRVLDHEPGGSGFDADLLYGFEKAALAQASDLWNHVRVSEADRVGSATTRRLGELFGFPDCCIDAFCSLPQDEQTASRRGHIRRRREIRGAVDPRLNPITGLTLGHVVCALDCRATIEQAQLVEKALAETHTAELAALRRRQKSLTLFRLDGDPSVVSVDAVDEGGGFRFGSAEVLRGDLCPEALLLGDRLSAQDGLVSVHGEGGRHVGDLVDWGVWWHGGDLSDTRIRHTGADASGRSDSPFEAQTELSLRVREILSTQEQEIHDQTGFDIESVSAVSDSVRVTMTGPDLFCLRVDESENEPRAYVRGAQLAVSYESNTPLDSREKEKAIAIVHRLLEDSFRRQEEGKR